MMVVNDEIPKEKVLDSTDWDNLCVIKEILYPLKIAQKLLEGQHYVTVSFIPAMVAMIREKWILLLII